MFVPPGTKIDAALRVKAAGAPILASPQGYRYFYTVSSGGPMVSAGRSLVRSRLQLGDHGLGDRQGRVAGRVSFCREAARAVRRRHRLF